MLVLGLPRLNLVGAIGTKRQGPPQWALFITVLLWNTSGYDSIGACAGDVRNPSVNFPKALLTALALTITMDMAILLVGVSVFAEYTTWKDGTFVKVAAVLGGRPLAVLFAVGASINVVGLMCALLCTSSRILYGMATVGTLPKVFATMHPVYNTPYVSMATIAMLMALTTFMPFAALAEAEMWFYSLSTILKFLALVRLRQKQPDAPRPFRIPLSTSALHLFVLTPILCCIGLVVFSERRTHLLGLAGVLLSLGAYFVGTRFGTTAGGSSKKDTLPLIDFEALGDL
eukprot:SM000073S21424  [mRNA]  locus=s73:167791:169487:- [translate_table: standard]